MATKKKTKATKARTVKKSKAKANTKAKVAKKTGTRAKAKTTARKKSTRTTSRARTAAKATKKTAVRNSTKAKSPARKKTSKAGTRAKGRAARKSPRSQSTVTSRSTKKQTRAASEHKKEMKALTPRPRSEETTSARPSVNTSPKASPVKTRIRPLRNSRMSRSPMVSRHDRNLYHMAHAAPQFNYMKAPGLDHAFEVGDTVEVFCDHEKNSERVRGWIKGVVVQLDNKMVAVQFRSNVFLTDGWMVPDRILWYSLTSDQIREPGSGKKGTRKDIPDY